LSASHGQGWGYITFGKVQILALVVNNAIGSVYKDNKLFHKGPINFNDVKQNKNTTIIVLITNLVLDEYELKQLNHQVNVSIGETIKPFNTFVDGDVFYTCSTQKIKHKFNTIQMIKFFNVCSHVVKDAIINSTKR